MGSLQITWCYKPEAHALKSDLFQQIKKNKLQRASMLHTVASMEIMTHDHKFFITSHNFAIMDIWRKNYFQTLNAKQQKNSAKIFFHTHNYLLRNSDCICTYIGDTATGHWLTYAHA
jgi:hypothetical protein